MKTDCAFTTEYRNMAQLIEMLTPYSGSVRQFFPVSFQPESLFGSPISNIQEVDLPFHQLEEMNIGEFEQNEVRKKFVDSVVCFIKECSIFLNIEQTKLVINNIIGKDIYADLNVKANDKTTLFSLLKAYLPENEKEDYFQLGLIPLYFNSSIVPWGALSYSIQEQNNLDLSCYIVVSSLRYNLNDSFLSANAIEEDGCLNVWHTFKNIGEELFQREVVNGLNPFFLHPETGELPFIIAKTKNFKSHMNNTHYLDKHNNSLTSVREILDRLYKKEPLLFTVNI